MNGKVLTESTDHVAERRTVFVEKVFIVNDKTTL